MERQVYVAACYIERMIANEAAILHRWIIDRDVDRYENKVAAALHPSESGNKARVGKEEHRKDGRKDTSRQHQIAYS